MYSSGLVTQTTTPTATGDTPSTSAATSTANTSSQPIPQVNASEAASVAAAAAAAAATAAASQAIDLKVAPAPTTSLAVPATQHVAAPGPAQMQPQMAAAAAAAAAFGQYPAGMVFAPPEAAVMEDQPTYVNPKQYARILKRRESRKKQTGTDVTSYTPRKRSYMHESRHKHAMQRRRGPGGRFLSKEERNNTAKETVAAGQ